MKSNCKVEWLLEKITFDVNEKRVKFGDKFAPDGKDWMLRKQFELTVKECMMVMPALKGAANRQNSQVIHYIQSIMMDEKTNHPLSFEEAEGIFNNAKQSSINPWICFSWKNRCWSGIERGGGRRLRFKLVARIEKDIEELKKCLD